MTRSTTEVGDVIPNMGSHGLSNMFYIPEGMNGRIQIDISISN